MDKERIEQLVQQLKRNDFNGAYTELIEFVKVKLVEVQIAEPKKRKVKEIKEDEIELFGKAFTEYVNTDK